MNNLNEKVKQFFLLEDDLFANDRFPITKLDHNLFEGFDRKDVIHAIQDYVFYEFGTYADLILDENGEEIIHLNLWDIRLFPYR